MKKFFTALMTMLTLAAPASAWEIDDLNTHIDQTNFFVGRGCSGTLVDLDTRLILTNYHCIAGQVKFKTERNVARDGTVTTKQITNTSPVTVFQRTYDGHDLVSSAQYVTNLVGWDIDLDLALLQFRSETIPFNRHAVISTIPVRRGEDAWVVGNPLGLENTVTKGVISSTNRLLAVNGVEHPFLQVDAGITGGNSGGSLYNDDGLMIGVPAAGAPGTVVGLAIPATFIIEFLDDQCRAYVYDANQQSYADCVTEEEEDDNEDS